MKNKLQNFMIGRNGSDEYARFTGILACVFAVLSLFFKGFFRDFLLVLCLAALILTYFRVFSKNLAARRRENNDYKNMTFKFREKIKLRRDMWTQRKDFKFFKCPSCHAVLRVPKNKGKIRIVCKKCGTSFERKT